MWGQLMGPACGWAGRWFEGRAATSGPRLTHRPRLGASRLCLWLGLGLGLGLGF